MVEKLYIVFTYCSKGDAIIKIKRKRDMMKRLLLLYTGKHHLPFNDHQHPLIIPMMTDGIFDAGLFAICYASPQARTIIKEECLTCNRGITCFHHNDGKERVRTERSRHYADSETHTVINFLKDSFNTLFVFCLEKFLSIKNNYWFLVAVTF